MGQAIQKAITESDNLEFAGVWRRGESLDDIVRNADVLVDFSLPEAQSEIVAAVSSHEKPLVCGVSGLNATQIEALRNLSATVAVVYDRNMSQGIAVLHDIVRRVAQSLGPDYNIAIHETHHVHKLDSPSGTALQLGDAVADGQGVEPSGAKIEYRVERRGEVPGDHSVVWSSPTESLTLGHSVTTRDVFAAGAVRAASWVADQPPGLYSMQDVLFAANNPKKT